MSRNIFILSCLFSVGDGEPDEIVCSNDALKVEQYEVTIDGEPVARDRIAFNPSKCDQCGDCIEACPYDMIHETENPKLPIAGFCTLCGQCIEACPEDALCYK